MDKVKRSVLNKIAKDFKEYGTTDSGLYIPKGQGILEEAIDARDLIEDTLGNEILKRTGVPIPSKGATRSEMEKFTQDIMTEQFGPERTRGMQIQIRDNLGSYGQYDPNNQIITLDKELVKTDPARAIGTAVHEGPHYFDDIEDPNFKSQPISKRSKLLEAKKKFDVNSNSFDIYEFLGGDHTRKIPGRMDTSGLSNLKNALSGKILRGLGPLATGAGAAAALASGDVAALSGVENVGEGSTDMSDSYPARLSRSMEESGELDPIKFQALRKRFNKTNK